MAEKKFCTEDLKEAGLSVIKPCKLTLLFRATFYRRQLNWRERDRAVIDAV
ncbi:hypothetical protein JEP26_04445 [Proteus mirabilis]|nr:hypothetical protein [Proteus mirabilis]MBI6295697.1 hypothetical protein [Proteus mirabilis]HEK0326949.1 hypothetical protein [Proteus mirabilis]HEK2019975.1 hypothetical protein [Proteus mirabilis]HEK2098981.1 hypothetical protein [Proteus mirabilis]